MRASIAVKDRSTEIEAARDVPIRSISRGIAVLTALNRNGAMPMMAISKSTALPYPTVNRIVQTLLHDGLIEHGNLHGSTTG